MAGWESVSQDSGFRTIVDDNDGTVLGVVQSSYKLVPYEDLVEKFEAGLTSVLDQEYDYMEVEKNVRFYQGKSQLAATYSFPAFAFDINGDNVHPQVTLESSYNRTRKLGFIFSIMRLVCTNGFVCHKPLKV